MLKKEKIDRINHLAKKSKQEGLTEAEKEEQAVLRKEYIENFREQFKGHLNRVKFVEDLSEEELARLQKENEEIRRANAKAQREQEHLELSGEQLQEKYGLEVQELSKYARGIELIKKGKREAKEAAAAGREQAAQYHSER